MNKIRTHFSALWTIFVIAFVFGLFAVANAQTATTLTAQLQEGDSGPQVSALQTFLATDKSIYPQGLVTGYYGPLTAAAVERFQCAHGIVCSGDAASTGYGRVGPQTLRAINAMYGSAAPQAGGSAVGVYAPIISNVSVATTSTTATVTWTTNVPSTNSAMYATTWPFLLSAAPSVASSGGVSTLASVTLTGLQPDTTYYVVPQSIDAAGGLQWSYGHSFKTGS